METGPTAARATVGRVKAAVCRVFCVEPGVNCGSSRIAAGAVRAWEVPTQAPSVNLAV